MASKRLLNRKEAAVISASPKRRSCRFAERACSAFGWVAYFDTPITGWMRMHRGNCPGASASCWMNRANKRRCSQSSWKRQRDVALLGRG